jgi:aryl-alcohol dehydrogenase-like predicted oxidoreductase
VSATFDFPVANKERAWSIIDVMGPIAKAHERGPAQVALAWILSKPVVTAVLLGARHLDQLTDNLTAIQIKLTGDEVRSLDEASQLPPEYPDWMVATQGADRLGPVEHWSQSVNQR